MEVMAIIGALAMLVGIVIIAPFINFAEGWIVGHLIKWIFGATFVSGLAMLGIHTSPPESIPVFCGVLAVIGSFFKSTTINRKKND